jgi:hypothetical protein
MEGIVRPIIQKEVPKMDKQLKAGIIGDYDPKHFFLISLLTRH